MTAFDTAVHAACRWVIDANRLARRCGRPLRHDIATLALQVADEDAELVEGAG